MWPFACANPCRCSAWKWSKESLLLRLLASELVWMRTNSAPVTLNRDDWGKSYRSAHKSCRRAAVDDDSASSTVMEIGAKARRLKRDRGLSLLVVDYLQLVVPTHMGRGTNRQEEVSSISRGLKGLAKELKVPVLRSEPVNPRTRA